MATPPGDRNYWALAGWGYLLLLSAANLADQLDGQNRSNLTLVASSTMAVVSLRWIVKGLWPRSTKADPPATD